MTPLFFKPILKRIRWGGRRLGSVLGKEIGHESDYAESWEIADHGHDQSMVLSGENAGSALGQLVAEKNSDLFGQDAGLEQFPLLMKFLDANDWLSLQVHPNDEQAKAYDATENGKTEAWIILHAEPGSEICVGLKRGIGREDFVAHLKAGTIEETLNKFEVSAGDCVFVPAGTVHAIGSGVLLAEVQQQSDLTFRLHDWGRVGSDGKPRELHIEQSLACIDFERGPVNPVVPVPLDTGDHRSEELVHCDYFIIRRHCSEAGFELQQDSRFRIVMVLEGDTLIRTNSGTLALAKGQTALLPACLSQAEIIPSSSVTLL